MTNLGGSGEHDWGGFKMLVDVLVAICVGGALLCIFCCVVVLCIISQRRERRRREIAAAMSAAHIRAQTTATPTVQAVTPVAEGVPIGISA